MNEKYGIVRELAGHGVGVKIHEDPYVPNYGKAGKGQRLIPGMIIAIEPMLNIGGDEIIVAPDNWTIKTADGSKFAHFEHTYLLLLKVMQKYLRLFSYTKIFKNRDK